MRTIRDGLACQSAGQCTPTGRSTDTDQPVNADQPAGQRRPTGRSTDTDQPVNAYRPAGQRIPTSRSTHTNQPVNAYQPAGQRAIAGRSTRVGSPANGQKQALSAIFHPVLPLLSDNSPALQRWEPRGSRKQVPQGRKNRSADPCGTLSVCLARRPSDESLGYCHSSSPCSPLASALAFLKFRSGS